MKYIRIIKLRIAALILSSIAVGCVIQYALSSQKEPSIISVALCATALTISIKSLTESIRFFIHSSRLSHEEAEFYALIDKQCKDWTTKFKPNKQD